MPSSNTILKGFESAVHSEVADSFASLDYYEVRFGSDIIALSPIAALPHSVCCGPVLLEEMYTA